MNSELGDSMADTIVDSSKEFYEELGDDIKKQVSLTALAESLANIRVKFDVKDTEVDIENYLWDSRAKWCPSLAAWAQTAHNLLDHSLLRCFEYWLIRTRDPDLIELADIFDDEWGKLKGPVKREFLHDFTNTNPNAIFKIINHILEKNDLKKEGGEWGYEEKLSKLWGDKVTNRPAPIWNAAKHLGQVGTYADNNLTNRLQRFIKETPGDLLLQQSEDLVKFYSLVINNDFSDFITYREHFLNYEMDKVPHRIYQKRQVQEIINSLEWKIYYKDPATIETTIDKINGNSIVHTFTGIGGIGKTALCYEVIRRLDDDFEYYPIFSAKTKEQGTFPTYGDYIEDEMWDPDDPKHAAIHHHLGGDAFELMIEQLSRIHPDAKSVMTFDQKKEKLIDFLTNNKVLLTFDNFEDIEAKKSEHKKFKDFFDIISKIVNFQSKIILTSRMEGWESATKHEVLPLTVEERNILLKKRISWLQDEVKLEPKNPHLIVERGDTYETINEAWGALKEDNEAHAHHPFQTFWLAYSLFVYQDMEQIISDINEGVGKWSDLKEYALKKSIDGLNKEFKPILRNLLLNTIADKNYRFSEQMVLDLCAQKLGKSMQGDVTNFIKEMKSLNFTEGSLYEEGVPTYSFTSTSLDMLRGLILGNNNNNQIEELDSQPKSAILSKMMKEGPKEHLVELDEHISNVKKKKDKKQKINSFVEIANVMNMILNDHDNFSLSDILAKDINDYFNTMCLEVINNECGNKTNKTVWSKREPVNHLLHHSLIIESFDEKISTKVLEELDHRFVDLTDPYIASDLSDVLIRIYEANPSINKWEMEKLSDADKSVKQLEKWYKLWSHLWNNSQDSRHLNKQASWVLLALFEGGEYIAKQPIGKQVELKQTLGELNNTHPHNSPHHSRSSRFLADERVTTHEEIIKRIKDGFVPREGTIIKIAVSDFSDLKTDNNLAHDYYEYVIQEYDNNTTYTLNVYHNINEHLPSTSTLYVCLINPVQSYSTAVPLDNTSLLEDPITIEFESIGREAALNIFQELIEQAFDENAGPTIESALFGNKIYQFLANSSHSISFKKLKEICSQAPEIKDMKLLSIVEHEFNDKYEIIPFMSSPGGAIRKKPLAVIEDPEIKIEQQGSIIIESGFWMGWPKDNNKAGEIIVKICEFYHKEKTSSDSVNRNELQAKLEVEFGIIKQSVATIMNILAEEHVKENILTLKPEKYQPSHILELIVYNLYSKRDFRTVHWDYIKLVREYVLEKDPEFNKYKPITPPTVSQSNYEKTICLPTNFNVIINRIKVISDVYHKKTWDGWSTFQDEIQVEWNRIKSVYQKEEMLAGNVAAEKLNSDRDKELQEAKRKVRQYKMNARERNKINVLLKNFLGRYTSREVVGIPSSCNFCFIHSTLEEPHHCNRVYCNNNPWTHQSIATMLYSGYNELLLKEDLKSKSKNLRSYFENVKEGLLGISSKK